MKWKYFFIVYGIALICLGIWFLFPKALILLFLYLGINVGIIIECTASLISKITKQKEDEIVCDDCGWVGYTRELLIVVNGTLVPPTCPECNSQRVRLEGDV